MPREVPLPLPVPIEHRRRARQTIARHALDAQDLRYLLNVLALWPEQDGLGPRVAPLALDPGIVRRRRL